MREAKRQAERYAWALDEWPPFLVIVDVGRSIELWSDFSRQGKAYLPFPDSARQTITMEQLADPAIRQRLRAVWLDPLSLDPANERAEVTSDIAERLGRLVRSIGGRCPEAADGTARNAHAGKTARFVMQCIFAMFADSVGLIEQRGFLGLLKDYRGHAQHFHFAAAEFFRCMDVGGHCAAIQQDLPRFNGGLFADIATLAITEEELEALIEAAQCDWTAVEPAIFGSLLENALDARQRTELGAHYTPRAFVERLVGPTVMEPLRERWEAVESCAIGAFKGGRASEAQQMVRRFHSELCQTRVLDPACGTGNFLYVAMGMMKALEGEILNTLIELGDPQGVLELAGHSVSPEQFVGIEKNRYAVWIAKMVLWIGHLQWQFRTFGNAKPTEPILKDAATIVEGDAVLSFDREELDHKAMAARAVWASPGDLFDSELGREINRYSNPRPTPWPEADFIVGNPPFMGAKDMRRELGDGYVDALWAIRDGRFRSADLVTVWWDRAAEILTAPNSRLKRFGFITTNSIVQTFSRRVIDRHLTGSRPVRLVYGVPDHPWIKGGSHAAVRIAMSVAEAGEADGSGRACQVVSEADLTGETPAIVITASRGDLGCDLRLSHGSDLTVLRAQSGLCARGVQLMGAGFAVTPAEAATLFERSAAGLRNPARPYRNGRDMADRSRGLMAIDLFGLTEVEARRGHPGFYQHLLETVKATRDRNNRATYRANWWTFGEPRRDLRTALDGLPRYIVTAETAKHRWFRFLDAAVLADNKLVVVASDRAEILGVLSSSAHAAWFSAHCGKIGVYAADAVYVKGACFDTFPFPELNYETAARLAALTEELEALRDRALNGPSALALTALYNLRDRRKGGAALTPAEQRMVVACDIGILDHLHDQIDRCVRQAYGWADQPDVATMQDRLRLLHRERVADEAAGVVRYLRPEFQQPRVPAPPPVQMEADLRRPHGRLASPTSSEELAFIALRALRTETRPVGSDALAQKLGLKSTRKLSTRLAETLSILSVAGTVQQTADGWYAPRRPD